MRKYAMILLLAGSILYTSGCVYSHNYDENGNEMTEDEVNEAIDDIKENVKNDIDDALSSETSSTVIGTTIDLDLTSEDTDIYSIQLADETKATLRYSYSIDDADNVILGYHGEDNAPAELELSPATEEDYDAIWEEAPITLHSGETTFYLRGENVHCRMILQIENIEEDNLVNAQEITQ